MKSIVAALVAAAFLVGPITASANPPYAPKAATPSSLIQSSGYEEIPIKIILFDAIATRNVVNKGRVDFEQSYDVMMWDFVTAMEEAAKQQTAVAVVDASIIPNARKSELRVYGKSSNNNGMRFTLGSPDFPYTFQIDVSGDDQSKAVVTVRNATFAMIYGGTMPARVGFKPAGNAPEIPFRFEG